ncbi:MAG: UbiD family decarboxylase [Candidatus Aenigmatarchaeota archaeon]
MSLREFLGGVEDKNILRESVRPDYELPALIAQDESKPVVFENIEGYPDCKVVSNLVSTRELISRALKTERGDLIGKISESLDSPKECEVTDPEFEKVVEDPDLQEHFPVPIFYKKKKRRYMASSIVISKDPETGVQNMSFHRMMLREKNKLAMRLVKRHLHTIYTKSEKPLQIAIVMGVDPAVEVAAATSYSPDLDELELANTYLDGGLEVAEIGGLKVPSKAEVVMMAEIKDEEVEEGPFVDLSKTWDIERKQPAVEVKELWMRDDPRVRILLPGKKEHSHLMGVPQEPRIYKIVENTVPTVKNVVLTPGGCSWLHSVVQINKRNEGDAKNAGMAALAAHPSMKKVTVVDEDVDPADPEQVEWATATRMQPHKDIIFIERAKGSSLDPSQDYENRLMTKWIVDTTVPYEDKDPGDFERAELPREGNVDLEDYR